MARETHRLPGQRGRKYEPADHLPTDTAYVALTNRSLTTGRTVALP
jgi:hypothetical protein